MSSGSAFSVSHSEANTEPRDTDDEKSCCAPPASIAFRGCLSHRLVQCTAYRYIDCSTATHPLGTQTAKQQL